jgi:selenide, water dikinase
MPTVKLTALSHGAGCACKLSPAELHPLLAELPRPGDPNVLVGSDTADDAAAYRVSDDLAILTTVDFFTPIVDDPYDFGRIAATNALSDIYAMGGEPLTAMNIAGFPAGKLPIEVLGDILRGAQDIVHAAGAIVIGGHTVTDDEVKFGLSVTGRIDPNHMLTNDAAVAGDVLVLTKPLGTGILATAAKNEKLGKSELAALVASMTTLNAVASRVALALDARCATDVTGFGLLGHASHIARASRVQIRIDRAKVPVLPGAREAWAAGARTGGGDRNLDFVRDIVSWGDASEVDRALLVDPQTSGGLLVALRPERAPEYLSRVESAAIIGEVVAKGAPGLVVA